MYRLWFHGLYGLHRPLCPLSPKRTLNWIIHSPPQNRSAPASVVALDASDMNFMKSIHKCIVQTWPVLREVTMAAETAWFTSDAGLPWAGKNQGNSSLSKSQGKDREFGCKSGNFVICYQSQGKVREFHLWCLSMYIFHHLENDIWTRRKSWIRFSFKYHLPNDFFLNFICFHVLHNVRHKISTIFMMLKMFSCADLF